MADENQDDGLIRRYLLGQLGEDELQRLEERMMADNEFFNGVLLAEDELVEDYVQGELPDRDRARFEASFLATPEGRHKVAYATALGKYVQDVSPSPDLEVLIAKEPVIHAVAAEKSLEVSPLADAVVAEEPRKKKKLSRPAWWNRPALVSYFRLATAAVVVLGLGLVVWWLIRPQPSLSQGLAALNKAFQQGRPIEPRISGFQYAPSSVTRGDASQQVDTRSLNRAERILLDEASDHPSAASHHALGRLYLAEKKFDYAIKEFDDALQTEPNNAELHSDYGVLLLEVSKTEDSGKRLETLARSLDHLSTALKLNQSLLEPLFNRALCYEYLGLLQKSEEAWQGYLGRDSSSQWAAEARRKLRDLESQKPQASQNKEDLFEQFTNAYQTRDAASAWQAIRQGRARAGNVIIEKLLDAYLDRAAHQQKDDGDRALQMVSYAGQLEYEKTGDRFTRDLARLYQASLPKQRETLSEARHLMKAAGGQYDKDEHEQAIASYATAKRIFQQAGDSCEAVVAECWTGIANLRIAASQSLRILEPLSETLKEREYKYLLAQALNGRADAESSRRAFTRTLELGKQASDLSEQIDDVSGTLRNLQLPVGMHQRFGEYHESLTYIARAFDLASKFSPEPYEVWPFYQQTAFNFYSLQLYAAALDFQQEALRLALASSLPLLKSRSYARLGLIYERLNNEQEAMKNAETALAEAQTIQSKKSRENVIANSALNLAHLYRERGDFGRAVTLYDQAIQLHNALNIQIYLFEAHKGKLISLIGLNDDTAAEAEMKTAVDVVEEYRPKISDESNRNGFFDLAQSIYDLAIDFSHSRKKDDRLALHYSEFSRARSLLDLMKSNDSTVSNGEGKPDVKLQGRTSPVAIRDLAGLLPKKTRVLEYSMLDDKVLIWVISKDGIESKESPTSTTLVTERIRRYLDLIAKSDEGAYQEATSTAKQLYESLISPIEPMLGAEDYICIVPDKALAYLPFGALLSPSSRYFVEDYCFGFAPSANVFLASSESAVRQAKETRGERFLGVGNPSFDRSRYADLRKAAKEVNDIANFYETSLTLTEEDARERRVKEEMKRAEVIQLASHYVVDEQSPLLSKLVLAREPESGAPPSEDGFLQASEVYDMRLRRTRLVVLSACQTGVERSYRGEGAISAARPFLKAGVPLVVASLWPVDSDYTTDLMISFHKHRKQDCVTSAEALRRAQLDMLHSPDAHDHHPYYWAAFAATGGYAQY